MLVADAARAPQRSGPGALARPPGPPRPSRRAGRDRSADRVPAPRPPRGRRGGPGGRARSPPAPGPGGSVRTVEGDAAAPPRRPGHPRRPCFGRCARPMAQQTLRWLGAYAHGPGRRDRDAEPLALVRPADPFWGVPKGPAALGTLGAVNDAVPDLVVLDGFGAGVVPVTSGGAAMRARLRPALGPGLEGKDAEGLKLPRPVSPRAEGCDLPPDRGSACLCSTPSSHHQWDRSEFNNGAARGRRRSRKLVEGYWSRLPVRCVSGDATGLATSCLAEALGVLGC